MDRLYLQVISILALNNIILLLFTTSWLEVSLLTRNIVSVSKLDFLGCVEVSDPQPRRKQKLEFMVKCFVFFCIPLILLVFLPYHTCPGWLRFLSCYYVLR